MTIPALIAVASLLVAPADEPAPPPTRYRIVMPPTKEGFVAAGINGKGEVVGFAWEEEQPGVLAQAPRLFGPGKWARLPLLKGYTATFPAALSDDGLVVGRVSRPPVPGGVNALRTQGFVWREAGGIRGLGAVEADLGSYATGVSRDGKRIAGASFGAGRGRAVVWDRVDGAGAEGETWRATPLPHEGNLSSSYVAISGDGRRVASSEGGRPCLWTRNEAGTWHREPFGPEGVLSPRAVNDAGSVVGVRMTPDGNAHGVTWTRAGGFVDIPEPAGYVRSQALAINDRGAVVGLIDGKAGTDVVPAAFVFEAGRLRVLTEGGPHFAAASAINNRDEVAGTIDEEGEDAPPPNQMAGAKPGP